MIRVFIKTLKESNLRELAHFESGAWVMVESPTEEELADVAGRFSIDLGLLKDAIDFYEVPRIEIEDSATFIYTQFPIEAGLHIVTIPVLFVLGRDFFITVSSKRFPNIDRFLEEKLEFFTTQKTKLFLQLFSEVNSAYNQHLTRIIRQVKSSRIKLEKITNQDIIQLVAHEEVLNNFLSVLIPTRNVLNSILTGRFVRLFEEDKDLVEDLSLDNLQLTEICKSNLKNIVNIRDAYSTIMTNNLNSIMKLLTSVTVVLMVPNIISGLYGMNVELPLQNSPMAFIALTGAIVVISVMILLFFIRKFF